MQINLHGLSFSVFNKEKNKHVVFETYSIKNNDDETSASKELKEILKSSDLLNNQYFKTVVLYQDRITTLVPSELFDAKNKEIYLNFNQPGKSNRKVLFDKIKNLDIVNVFSIPQTIFETLTGLGDNILIKSFSSSFIECISVNFKNKITENTFFINVNNNDFDIVKFNNNKLVFHNIFNFNTKEDFIYFLLASIEQLGFNPADIELIMSGNIEKTGKIFPLIERYIGSYRFIEKNENIGYSYTFDELRFHQYYVLLNAFQCA